MMELREKGTTGWLEFQKCELHPTNSLKENHLTVKHLLNSGHMKRLR